MPEERGTSPGQASSLGPGGGWVLKALDSEKDLHCPGVSQRSQGQPSPPVPWLQAEKQGPAWTGEGQSPRGGSAVLFALA